jgi:hypothetical protein
MLNRIGRIRLARVKVSSRGGGQMTASGKSPYTDVILVYAVLAGMHANGPQSALRVFEFDRIVVLRPKPILQHKCSNPMAVQPGRNLRPLMVERKMLISTTGSDGQPRCALDSMEEDT